MHQCINFFDTRFDHTGQRLAAEHARAAVAQTRHFNLYVRVGQQLFGKPRLHFDFFCVLGRRAQSHGDVAGDQVPGDGNHRRVAYRSTGEDGHIGAARTNVDQRHTEFFFICRQHRVARGQRVEHQLFYIQAAAAHAFDDVFRRALCPGDDVYLGFQPYAAHTYRLFHVLAVDDEFLRFDQQQTLVVRDVHGLGGFDHARYIGGCDFAVLDRHHAVRIHASDVAAGDAGIDPGDLAVGHQFGFLQSHLYALNCRVYVDHHAALEAGAGRNAKAGQFELGARQHLGHHHHDFAGADVQAYDQVFVFFCHANLFVLTLLPLYPMC